MSLKPTISDDDLGYYVQTGVGTSTPGSNNLFYNEAGGTFPIGGGTDRSVVNTSGVGTAFTDGNIHTASFTIRRTSPTAISLSVTYDGTTTFTGSTSTNLRTSFSEIAFTDGFVATPVQFAIDEVVVTSNVPEPGVGLIWLAGAAAMAVGRRRGQVAVTSPC